MEPFTLGALIGDFLQAEKFEESFVGGGFFEIRQAGSPEQPLKMVAMM
ncbi:hypothetical protein OAE72_00470 [Akkermansiaceae bacterium]|nr:hypothetical protein [bacterium]MDB4526839.1 hypothetical protein [bacterium]MDB4680404.1 hypothetical protein [Akkermansiaceae bacterium]MDB4792817.1 hypothetical protein [bacterium]